MDHSMNQRYVMSIIRLPLHIHEDGTYTSMHDYIHMDFEPCPVLPPNMDQETCMKRLKELIRDVHESATVVTPMSDKVESNSKDMTDSSIESKVIELPWPTIRPSRTTASRSTTFKHYTSSMKKTTDKSRGHRHTNRREP